MFICGRCNKSAQPYMQPVLEVVEKRKKVYAEREKANLSWKKDGDLYKLVPTDDPGGVGYETVREIKVCPDCAA